MTKTTVEFLDLATMDILAVTDHDPSIEPLEGDEIELNSIGQFKVVRRRWSFSDQGKALILMLERLS